MEVVQLIDALARSTAYPYPVEAVEVRQTHISVVFLAGPFAYKVKKPVRLAFLDFSTLAERRHYCEEEVRLNRRLAPQVYLGVVPVVMRAGTVAFEGDGEVIDWAVKMQRLPDEATLHERLRRDDVGPELVEALACRVASFHHRAQRNDRTAANGRFAVVERIVHDVLALARPHVGTTVEPGVFEQVTRLAESALAAHRPLIEDRAARGLPRDCHGDLHLDHIYCFPERLPPADLVIIDCIEFNERFRFSDPVADMAFAAMDFAFHGRWDLAGIFADAYFRASGDEEGEALLPLYAAYRAGVRGAVEGLLLGEPEVPASERQLALERARAHWLLALALLEAPATKPCLVLIGGLPGTGKSTLAREVAARAGFTVVRSDVVRKELAGLSPNGPAPERWREAIYSTEWNARTYAECWRRAEALLAAGGRVLVDATFREEEKRQAFLDEAVRWGVPHGMLLCVVEPATALERLAQRHGDASDADARVYAKLAANWEPFGARTARAIQRIDTAGCAEQSVGRILAALRNLGVYEEVDRCRPVSGLPLLVGADREYSLCGAPRPTNGGRGCES